MNLSFRSQDKENTCCDFVKPNTKSHKLFKNIQNNSLLIYFCYLFEQSQDKKNQDVITGSLLQGLDNQNTEDKAVSTYSEHQER